MMRLVRSAAAALAMTATATAGQPQVGVYMWAGAQGAANIQREFTPFWGARPAYAVDFIDFSSWQAMEGEGLWAIGSWKGRAENLVLSVPLTVQGTTLADVAAGGHDAVFQRIAQALRDDGFPRAVVRIGWEMNGGWYPWGNLNDDDAAKRDAKIAAFKAAFVHVAGLFKAVSPGFRINWCPAGGWLQIPAPDAYPGDVVDEIGLDLYASVWGTDHPTAAQVEAAWQKNWQLDWIAGFAKAQNKPFSLPEFGIGDRPVGQSDYGPGDNAAIASYAVNWMKAHAPDKGHAAGAGELAWVGLWDVNAGDYNSQFTGGQRPKVARVLKAGLGPAAAPR